MRKNTADYDRQYQQAHKQMWREKSRRWYAKNREKAAAYHRKWYAKNREAVLEQQKAKRAYVQRPRQATEALDSKHYLGTLCAYAHEYRNSGKSLRYKSGGSCTICDRIRHQHKTKAVTSAVQIPQKDNSHENQDSNPLGR